ncbi:putative sensor domain DACNV-containing protein [Hymenobacter bucti]|uniref:Sensor domain DACNV-containing protein n=1 Tax=Hymenobacter bucti TaxID=1844114 RepID=A0ABW4QNC7_9BACT
MPAYHYPPDVANALRQQWPAHGHALPAPEVLTDLINVAYQASLLQEESRPVLAHLVLVPDSYIRYGAHQSPNYQLLGFTQPRPYHEQELRRLSPTVQRPGHLLAVSSNPAGELAIWGMVLTVRPWDYAHEPANPASLPPVLFVQVYGAGNLAFFCGIEQVLVLQNGRLAGPSQPAFPVAWIKGHFDEAAPLQGATDTVYLARQLAQHTARRMLTQAREAGHGGMVVLVPSANAAALVRPQGLLQPKYGLQANDLGTRYLTVLTRLAERSQQLGLDSWAAYRLSADGLLQTLHAELENFADLLAGLMTVDGALVLNKQFDVLGFGVEIHAPGFAANQVYRALDPEATRLQAEAADSGGTRHRAAYRLCHAEAACLVMVVSQDGGVKFVRQQQGQVVFWEQSPV